MNTRTHYTVTLGVTLTILTGFVAMAVYTFASPGNGEKLSAPAIAAPQALPVQVDRIKATPIRTWHEFSGRIDAVDLAEIRPQVSGTIKEVRFHDSQHVDKGDVLYVIDPRPYKAAVQQAQAELVAARNAQSLAASVFNRAKVLIESASISQRIYDERENEAMVSEANVQAAQARLAQAEINLDHAFVKAPISGITSRAEVKVGNLVSPGPNAPILTTIVSDDGVFAEFEVDESTYMEQLHLATRTKEKAVQAPVEIVAGNGDYTHKGFIHSLDNRIDSGSGTIRARAFLQNEDKTLLPGMFVRVRLGAPLVIDQILISERAIGTNQNHKFVYVVNEESVAEYRQVRIGDSIRGHRIVTYGLSEGDVVISDGIIRIRPGTPVAPFDDVVSAL